MHHGFAEGSEGFLDRIFLGTMMIAKFVEWVRFVLVKKDWVFVSQEFDGWEYYESDFDASFGMDFSASCDPFKFGVFSVKEKCANTGLQRVERKAAPFCFAIGGGDDNRSRLREGCAGCQFRVECIRHTPSD